MADDPSPSARERQLARELRQLRRSVELLGKDVAERLGWSASKVSRIETSHIGVSLEDLELLLTLYDVPRDQAEHLRKLAPSARPKGWWDAYADTITSGYANLIRLESGSRSVQCYSAVIPHPLLQVPDYTRHVIQTTAIAPSAAEVERRMAICRRRQEALTAHDGSPGLQLAAVVDEAVLRRQVVDATGRPVPGVLQAQIRHLVVLAGRPGITVQVLPFSAGIPPVTAGSFSVLESLAAAGPDVVYMDNKTRIWTIDAEGEVHAYAQEMAYLRRMALSRTASLAFLRQAANEAAHASG